MWQVFNNDFDIHIHFHHSSQQKGPGDPHLLGAGADAMAIGKTSRTILASKVTQLQVGVPNGKKTSQNGDQVGVKNGWKMWTKFKVFIVELEMSRLWQHFAASVINSVSGLPSPLGKSWSSLEQARPQGGGEAEGPWLLQLSEASMCRAQGFLQRPLFLKIYYPILHDERRRERMGFQDCSLYHLVSQSM